MSKTAKAITLTAFLAAIMAIPLVVGAMHAEHRELKPGSGGRLNGELLRYDIEDLLT